MLSSSFVLGILQLISCLATADGFALISSRNIGNWLPKLKVSTHEVPALLSLVSVSRFVNAKGLKENVNLRLRGGAKSKNHTNHNQNAKAHRNGIKRVKT